MTFKQLSKKIRRLRGASNFESVKDFKGKEMSNKIGFMYKGGLYVANLYPDGITFYINDTITGNSNHKTAKKIEAHLKTIGIEDVKKETEEIRKTATKLPKKKLKLESNIENFTNEICK
tara:strand:- start:194 stop:550 length:357 start_codon:yes stop_codon:yes gene_type:complete